MTGKKTSFLLLFFALLVMLTVLVTTVSVRIMRPREWNNHDQTHGHHWLQKELGLSEAEAAAIDAYEEPYRSERARLQAEFDEKVSEIARLLQTRNEFGPDVVHAIHELHIVHGALQEHSIRHYFDMLNTLSPENQEELRALAVEALSKPQ